MQEEPPDDNDGNIGEDLSPHHVDVLGSNSIEISLGLLDSLPYCQNTKANGEASS